MAKKMKMKSNRSVRKRFKITADGKVRARRRPGRSHLLAHKSSKRKRRLRTQKTILTGEDAALIRREYGTL